MTLIAMSVASIEKLLNDLVDAKLHICIALAVFLGFGADVAKSFPLFAESVQPALARTTAVELPGAAAAAPSKQLTLLPYPTRSTIFGSLGQVPLSGVVVFTSATLPAVAASAIDPLASGEGRATPLAPPEASWTR